MTNWTHNGEALTEAPEDCFGFVYLVTNLVTGQKYVGKKIFKNTVRRKVKGRKNRKVTIRESNWRDYKSSSKEVHVAIEEYGEDNFKFEILKVCKSKADWTYTEVREQFLRDVLAARLPNGEFEYYNSNISGKFHRTKEILAE